jgi:hypothetical protein
VDMVLASVGRDDRSGEWAPGVGWVRGERVVRLSAEIAGLAGKGLLGQLRSVIALPFALLATPALRPRLRFPVVAPLIIKVQISPFTT